MFFPPRSIESPNRYAQHLPADIEAATLSQALIATTQRFGEPKRTNDETGLTELLFELEEHDIRFYARGSELIAIRSMPKPRAQAFSGHVPVRPEA